MWFSLETSWSSRGWGNGKEHGSYGTAYFSALNLLTALGERMPGGSIEQRETVSTFGIHSWLSLQQQKVKCPWRSWGFSKHRCRLEAPADTVYRDIYGTPFQITHIVSAQSMEVATYATFNFRPHPGNRNLLLQNQKDRPHEGSAP